QLAAQHKDKSIVLIGPQNIGKTTIGRLAAAQLGYACIDSDDLMLECYNKQGRCNIVNIKLLYKKLGWYRFRQLERRIIQSIDFYRVDLVVSLGGGAHLYSFGSLFRLRPAVVVLLYNWRQFRFPRVLRVVAGYLLAYRRIFLVDR
ncbi:MAG: hypothetical protein HON55_03530, partial [Legionellales bacterium]|nr:hypothetical protein [Legionellales bacterium]